MIERPPEPAPDSGDVALGRTVPRVGERVGPYRVVRLLGEGTGGRVFEVLHEKLGRPAALKLLEAAHTARPSTRARFFAEALSITRINHPHIVEVTDIVETDEHAGLVMELLEGCSLGAAMRASALPPERFLPILAQVCEALAAAHEAGFVHRDLKPENVFLCERHGVSDFVKLLDFGVAAPRPSRTSVSGTSSSSSSRGRRGTFVGTPAYASPEQASGAPVDHTTDLYALGVMLFELVCGRLPFEGWTAGELLMQHLSAPVPHLPPEICATPLGRALDAVVQGCMVKDSALRFSSAAELGATLAALGRGEIVPIVTGATSLRRPRRRRAVVLAAVGVVLGGAAIAGASALLSPRGTELGAPVATAPAPAPAPAFVTLAFDSEPPGAEVRLVSDGTLLGLTPFRHAFPRGNDPIAVEFARAAFEPVRLDVRAAAPRSVSVRLSPVAALPDRAGTPRPAHRARGHLGSEKTLNPFHR
ncbi:MAG TPA: serine/threonine-protein kinase [Polyangia bacterium]|jgi:serine/threonine-protein kinase|nr:serine/threonine-protein kinase [Polyangia bacterium]